MNRKIRQFETFFTLFAKKGKDLCFKKKKQPTSEACGDELTPVGEGDVAAAAGKQPRAAKVLQEHTPHLVKGVFFNYISIVHQKALVEKLI